MNFARLWDGGLTGAGEVTIKSDSSVELLTGAEIPDIAGSRCTLFSHFIHYAYLVVLYSF